MEELESYQFYVDFSTPLTNNENIFEEKSTSCIAGKAEFHQQNTCAIIQISLPTCWSIHKKNKTLKNVVFNDIQLSSISAKNHNSRTENGFNPFVISEKSNGIFKYRWNEVKFRNRCQLQCFRSN